MKLKTINLIYWSWIVNKQSYSQIAEQLSFPPNLPRHPLLFLFTATVGYFCMCVFYFLFVSYYKGGKNLIKLQLMFVKIGTILSAKNYLCTKKGDSIMRNKEWYENTALFW